MTVAMTVAMAMPAVAVSGLGVGVSPSAGAIGAGDTGRMGMRGHVVHCTQLPVGAQPDGLRLDTAYWAL